MRPPVGFLVTYQPLWHSALTVAWLAVGLVRIANSRLRRERLTSSQQDEEPETYKHQGFCPVVNHTCDL